MPLYTSTLKKKGSTKIILSSTVIEIIFLKRSRQKNKNTWRPDVSTPQSNISDLAKGC